MKERSAGAFRLYILWFIYKHFGKSFLKFVVFFVALISFLFAREIRYCSAKYFKILSDFSQNIIESNFLHLFKHYLSYAYSLVDNIEIFSANYSVEKIFFENEADKNILFEDFDNGKGVFFICNHLGNVNAMRAFMFSNFKYSDKNVNVFMQTNQTKIFDEFIKNISAKSNVKLYPVENIGVDTAIEIEEKLKNSEIVFMAGDRVSANNTDSIFELKLFNRNIKLPIGTFRFAIMTGAPIYFVSCVKVKNDSYKIILKKADLSGNNKKDITLNLAKDFVAFLENNTLKYPFQFYHFYDLFSAESI